MRNAWHVCCERGTHSLARRGLRCSGQSNLLYYWLGKRSARADLSSAAHAKHQREISWRARSRAHSEAFAARVETGRRDMLEFAITFKADMPPARIVTSDPSGRSGRFHLWLVLRFPYPLAGPLSIADAHGGQHRTYAPRNVCHQPGGARSHGDGQLASDVESYFGRSHGHRHRPWR